MIGELKEFADGDYRILRVDDFEFGVFRQGDRVIAYENSCPHDGGPVCQGKVIPRVEEELAPDQTSRGLRFAKRRNIVCPWHGWEFDIRTGQSWCDPTSIRARQFLVTVAPGSQLLEGPYVAETFQVSIEEDYLIVDL